MMKFTLFTRDDGQPVLINRDHVQFVVPPGEMNHHAETMIMMLYGPQFVKETMEVVIQKLCTKVDIPGADL